MISLPQRPVKESAMPGTEARLDQMGFVELISRAPESTIIKIVIVILAPPLIKTKPELV